MYDRESVDSVAADIARWEAAAQQLPLPDLMTVITAWQHSLAENLDIFNDVFLAHADHDECTDLIKDAINHVVRQATATAIFTLGISQRAQQAARQN
jgi:hypothetical protein